LESEWVALVVFSSLAISVVLQQVIAPTRAALVGFTALVTIGCTALGLTVRRPLGNLLGGFRFASVVLFALGLAAVIGTVVLQEKPAPVYQHTYGGMAGFLVHAGFSEVAHSFWFAALLGLFLTGMAISMIQRWPVRARNAGFFASHLGLIAAVLGAGLSSLYAVKARLDLHVGEAPVTEAKLERKGEVTDSAVPLGFGVRLDKFDVDAYANEYRLAVYQPDKKGGYALKATFDPEVGTSHRLPRGGRFTLKGYYPDVTFSQAVEPAASDGLPALQVFVDGQEDWLIGAHDRVMSADGTTAVILGLGQLPRLEPTPRHLVTLGGVTRVVSPGSEVSFPGGVHLRVLRFFKRFNFDLSTHKPVNLPTGEDNPALEVQWVRDGKPSDPSWLYANFADFRHEGGEPADATYKFDPGVLAERAVLVAGEAKTAVFVEGGREERVSLVVGAKLAEGRVVLGKLYPHAHTIQKLATRSNEPRDPVAELEVLNIPGQGDGEVLLSAKERTALDLGTDSVLTLERRDTEVRSYQSRVTVTKDGVTQNDVVAVNKPLEVGGWKIYQVNYDPKDPSYSGFEVVRDPGVTWVFVGFVLAGLGVAYTMVVEPRFRRAKGV
jgi:hypothetical protein